MALLAVSSPLKTLNPTSNPSPSRRSSLLRLPPLLSRSGRLRCSAGYGDAAVPQQAAPTTPRPDEIPWSKELCNSVRLIGTVGTDVELRQLPSGSSVARGRIAVWKSATETTWVTLAFWDDLAVAASEHVKQGDKIFVSGRLVSDTVDEGPEKRQVYYKVVVQEFKFIESYQSVRLYEPESSQDTQGGKHGNYADNDSTAGKRSGDYMSSSSRSTEALWQAFFANPLDWWDNRKDKKNPKYPDFKHKSTGEALWVDGRSNPNWVISQLAILDSRMGSLEDRERKPVSYMYADDLAFKERESRRDGLDLAFKVCTLFPSQSFVSAGKPPPQLLPSPPRLRSREAAASAAQLSRLRRRCVRMRSRRAHISATRCGL